MQHFHILTGPPGAGKTALLGRLQDRGFVGIHEPARQILAEQRSFDGPGVPDKDPDLFTALMLSRSVADYRRQSADTTVSVFDRGVPDIIAYARLFGIDDAPARRAADVYRYNASVFFVPPWRAIYRQDDERKMTFDDAIRFGDIMREVYRALGYVLIDVPTGPLDDRADTVADEIRAGAKASGPG